MKQHSKEKILGKVYRQFSRTKYNKYKHLYPKMRESQIVTKIIKEWDVMNTEGKQKLIREYQQNKSSNRTEDVSQSQSARKSQYSVKSKRQKDRQRQTTIKKQTASKQQVISSIKYQNGIDQAEKLQKTQPLDHSQRQAAQRSQKKMKKMVKTSGLKGEYLYFFKNLFQMYKNEHPNWTAKQISQIIRLEWTKRKNKKQRIPKRSQNRPQLITGRKFFKKTKRLKPQECRIIWKRLPSQSKISWDKQSKGALEQSKKIMTVSYKSNLQVVKKGLDFLNKKMS